MATWMKSHWLVTTLKKKLQSVITGVSTINQKILSVMHTLHALTKQSKEQLLAQSRTLVVSLMNLVSILAILSLGVIGLLAHLIAHLTQQLASKLWKRGQ
jgi:hypothetical protein